jgi:GNAT superfamily N-acetyltransferase
MTDARGRYRVRRASAHDLPRLLAVLAENKAMAPPDRVVAVDGISERQAATWERMMNTPDLAVYLAESAGAAVGTASMVTMPNLTYDCRPTAFIEAVVVRYAHRRRGVGGLLLHQALTDARIAGCLKVQLLSHKRHAADGAHRLYRAAGFEPEAEGFRLYLDAWSIGE